MRTLVWNFSRPSLDCLVTDGIVTVEEKQTNCFGSNSTASVSTYAYTQCGCYSQTGSVVFKILNFKDIAFK